MEEMKVCRFDVGGIVELTNPLTGKRVLGEVCADGSAFIGYVDYDEPATPYPIFDVFEPEYLGDTSLYFSQVFEANPGDLSDFGKFVHALIDALPTPGTLSQSRALRWAVDNRRYFTDDDLKEAVAVAVQGEKEAREYAQTIRQAAELALSNLDQ